MPNIINITLPPSIEQALSKNMCFIAMNQLCLIGDLVTINLNGNIQYFKVIDIWESPKEFAIKYLWRMCGAQSREHMEKELDADNYKNSANIYAHMYKQVDWDKLKNLVKS